MTETVELVPIDSIRPDPNQPRKLKSPDQIKGLAQNFKQKGVGMINPIEVDDKGMIVTGELRWLAAKEAGFTHIRVRRFRPETSALRYLRQVSENVHQTSATAMRMSPLDTAHAFRQLCENEVKGKHGPLPEDGDDVGNLVTNIPKSRAPLTGLTTDQGQRCVGRRLGLAHQTIAEYLALLDPQATDPGLAKAINEGRLPRTMARVIKQLVPKEHRPAFTKRVVQESEKGRVGRISAEAVAGALRIQPDDPVAIMATLKADKTPSETKKALREIAPTLSEAVDAAVVPGQKLEKAVEGAIFTIREVGNAEMLPAGTQRSAYLAVLRLRDACNEFLAESDPQLAPVDVEVMGTPVNESK